MLEPGQWRSEGIDGYKNDLDNGLPKYWNQGSGVARVSMDIKMTITWALWLYHQKKNLIFIMLAVLCRSV